MINQQMKTKHWLCYRLLAHTALHIEYTHSILFAFDNSIMTIYNHSINQQQKNLLSINNRRLIDS